MSATIQRPLDSASFFGSFPKLYKPSLILPHQNTGVRGYPESAKDARREHEIYCNRPHAISLAIGLFAKEIVTGIYGQGFHNSAFPLQILLMGTVIFGIFATSIGGSLAGVNRPDLSLKAAGFSATINIILNILLIPHFGIIGAAIASTVSLATMAMIFYILTIKTISLSVNIQWMVKISTIGTLAIIFFVILSTAINFILLKAFIVLAYSATTFAMLIEKKRSFC